VPTFCRHNRFIDRCPICRRTLADQAAAGSPGRSSRAGGVRAGKGAAGSDAARGASTAGRSPTARRHPRRHAEGRQVRVRREARAEDDGFRSELAPGLHASDDAARLAEEIAFSSARLSRLHAQPPDLLGEIRVLAGEGEIERATWMCFLSVYLSPLPGDDPFAGIRLALARGEGRDVPSLEGIPLGPRTSHDPARGDRTLRAYRQWAERAEASGGGGGGAARTFTGEQAWTPQRRFERAFERLALPGLGRMGRYELLVTLGRLGLYEMQAASLHLAAGRQGGAHEDLTTLAAKRVLAVGEPIYLERRAIAFAQELSLAIDVLDLAFANWGAGERATLGFSPDTLDHEVLERAREALEL
jgi:hypothetical protein